MLRKYLFLILTIFIIIGYVVIQKSSIVTQKASNAPVITFDEPGLQVHTGVDEQTLLMGVHASDDEDGDLTSQVQVERISGFDSNLNRSYVSYIVFDSDDNLTRATRYIDYIDYTEPYFTLSDDLNGSTYSSTNLLSKVHAYSSLDGDISSKITIMNASIASTNVINVRLSVTDSSNTTIYLNTNYYIEEDSLIDIDLSKYLTYITTEQEVDFASYINTITVDNQETTWLNSLVTIEVPEDIYEVGIHEVIYRMNYNEQTGFKRLIVVTQDGGEAHE